MHMLGFLDLDFHLSEPIYLLKVTQTCLIVDDVCQKLKWFVYNIADNTHTSDLVCAKPHRKNGDLSMDRRIQLLPLRQQRPRSFMFLFPGIITEPKKFWTTIVFDSWSKFVLRPHTSCPEDWFPGLTRKWKQLHRSWYSLYDVSLGM